MERFYTLLFAAGLGCFGVAIVLSVVFPVVTLSRFEGMEFRSLDDLAAEPITEFRELAATYPEAFQAAFGTAEPTSAAYRDALQRGRDLYVGQACWHCHSQYVREVSNEPQRFGPPATAQEYENELYRPQLWGTRRVGPDLSREGGKRTNDWHVAHFINPKNVVPVSVMPRYPFYFDETPEGALVPNRDGFSLITYIQWLGTERERER